MSDRRENAARDGGPLHPTPNPDGTVTPGFSKIDEYASRALQAMIPLTVTVVEVKNNNGDMVSQLQFPDENAKNDIAIEAIQWGAAMLRAKGVFGL